MCVLIFRLPLYYLSAWRAVQLKGQNSVGFYKALVNLGGVEKVYTLLVLSRFDR